MRLVEEGFSRRLKYFLPVWALPFVLISVAIIEEKQGTDIRWTALLFLLANLPVLVAWTRHEIPLKEMLLLWWIAPFALWVGLVQLKLAFF